MMPSTMESFQTKSEILHSLHASVITDKSPEPLSLPSKPMGLHGFHPGHQHLLVVRVEISQHQHDRFLTHGAKHSDPRYQEHLYQRHAEAIPEQCRPLYWHTRHDMDCRNCRI